MNKLIRTAGLFLLIAVLVLSLAACGQRNTQPENNDLQNKEIIVETPPASPTPMATPTPSVPVAVTTVPMPMPSVSPTVGVTTTPDPAASDAAGTGTGTGTGTPASPAVSPSPSPSASPAPVYSEDAHFASTIRPDGYTVPANAVPGYVNANNVIVRGGPSGSAVILGTAEVGAYVDILAVENGWTEVLIGGTTGYIRSEYVTRGDYFSSPYYIGSNNGQGQIVVPNEHNGNPAVTPGDDYWNPNLGIMPD